MRISDWSSDVCSSDLYRSRRMRYRLPKQREAVFEGGAAVAGIFALRSHTERLGEIFLMQTDELAAGASRSIVAFEQQKGPAGHMAHRDGRHIETDRERKRQAIISSAPHLPDTRNRDH